MNLRRLILEIKPDGHELRVLYRRKDGHAPRPGTVRRRREVEALARDGLTAALEALDAGDVTDLGTSGFAVREDVLGLIPQEWEGDPMSGEAAPFFAQGIKQRQATERSVTWM